jgi:Xaa-Pro aminopeptidase
MKQNIAERLAALRAELKKDGIAACIIPQKDPHMSEYIADHWQARRWLSGFTGSAGTLVVTDKAALLWTDSRYFLQSAQQLEGTEIKLMKDGVHGTPSIADYLGETLLKGSKVGIDGMLFAVNETEQLEASLKFHNINLVTTFDGVGRIWADRPALPQAQIFALDTKYAGLEAKDKIAQVLENAKAQGAKSAFISALDEIAWLLNIRCKDVKYNPVATSFVYVQLGTSVIFIDPVKVNAEAEAYLKRQGVEVKPYDSVKQFLAALPADAKVLIEPAHTAHELKEILGDKAVQGESPIAVLKGCKNSTEIEGIRACHARDGVALVKSFMEIERKVSTGEHITEMDVAEILRHHRSERDLFFDESFGTICGYAGHGAIVHYEADEESNSTLAAKSLLLVDSGAQYFDGTTDITRTIALGEPTEMERRDFTLVMKGHIALGSAIFPTDTRGAQLDVLARQFLWKEGLSYLHGTGHGVGHFLNVHEGPQTIRLNNTPTPLMVGMLTSNEPGLYRENIHGIRCENLVLTVPAFSTEFGDFLKFETITLFPFDLRLFDLSIMTDEEIAWVNEYHNKVRSVLTPMLDTEEERQWLAAKTAPLKR